MRAAILVVWVVGGALAFAGAMAYAELAALRPHAGGEYVYLREAYGPIGGIPERLDVVRRRFLRRHCGERDRAGRLRRDGSCPAPPIPTPLLTVPLPFVPLVVSRQTLVALTVIAALTLVHVRGLRLGRVVQNVLAGIKVRRSSCSWRSASASATACPRTVTASGNGGLTPMLLALIPVMFTYSGWNAAAYVAEEVRSPERNVPLALGLGTLDRHRHLPVGLNALYLYALPVAELAAVPGARLIDTVAERLFGMVAGSLLAAFSIVSIAASISAMMIAGPRVYFAMARDGVFAAPAGEIHPRFRAPTRAIIAQAIWSGVLVLSGTLVGARQLHGICARAVLGDRGGLRSSSSAIASRTTPRPFRAWGYPWAPAIFVGRERADARESRSGRSPRTSAVGLAVIAAGVPIYWWMRRRNRSQ